MSSSPIVIKRCDFYDKVWSLPLTKLAQEFGISDAGLGKICKRHNIPKPGLGYWAKLEHGKSVRKIPLPPHDKGDYEITITPLGHFETSEDADLAQIEQANHVIRTIHQNNELFVLSTSLDQTDPIIAVTYRNLKNAPQDDHGYLQTKEISCLPIKVGPKELKRALLILDSLSKGFRKINAEIQAPSPQDKMIKVQVLGEILSFTFIEETSLHEIRSEPPKKDSYGYSWQPPKQYKSVPNGQMVFRLEDHFYQMRFRKVWSVPSVAIEKFLKRFTLALIELSVNQRTNHRRWERINRDRREQEQKIQELREKRHAEKERWDQLITEINNWQKSELIRAYVLHVENTIHSSGRSIEIGSEMHQWMAWATRRADILDPLVSMQAEEWEINLE
jgi:hypothetical protein